MRDKRGKCRGGGEEKEMEGKREEMGGGVPADRVDGRSWGRG